MPVIMAAGLTGGNKYSNDSRDKQTLVPHIILLTVEVSRWERLYFQFTRTDCIINIRHCQIRIYTLFVVFKKKIIDCI